MSEPFIVEFEFQEKLETASVAVVKTGDLEFYRVSFQGKTFDIVPNPRRDGEVDWQEMNLATKTPENAPMADVIQHIGHQIELKEG